MFLNVWMLGLPCVVIGHWDWSYWNSLYFSGIAL